MISNRIDLTANKSINKYFTSGLGTLKPHGWPLIMMAGKVCGAEGGFPTWEFSSTKSCEFLSHQWSLHKSLAYKSLSRSSFSELEGLLLLSSFPSPQYLYRFWKRQFLCTVYLFHYFVSQWEALHLGGYSFKD